MDLNRIYLILLILVAFIMPVDASVMTFESSIDGFDTGSQNTTHAYAGTYSFIPVLSGTSLKNITLPTNASISFYGYFPSGNPGSNTFNMIIYTGSVEMDLNLGATNANRWAILHNSAWSSVDYASYDGWHKYTFNKTGNLFDFYIDDVAQANGANGATSTHASGISFYRSTYNYWIDNIEIIDMDIPQELDIGGTWNTQVTTDDTRAFITACVGNSGGYYKLKSTSGTILRSSILTANDCMSSSEDLDYLYSLEVGNWIAYVTLPNTTIMAFDSFEVIPTVTPTPTPQPTPGTNGTPVLTIVQIIGNGSLEVYDNDDMIGSITSSHSFYINSGHNVSVRNVQADQYYHLDKICDYNGCSSETIHTTLVRDLDYVTVVTTFIVNGIDYTPAPTPQPGVNYYHLTVLSNTTNAGYIRVWLDDVRQTDVTFSMTWNLSEGTDIKLDYIPWTNMYWQKTTINEVVNTSKHFTMNQNYTVKAFWGQDAQIGTTPGSTPEPTQPGNPIIPPHEPDIIDFLSWLSANQLIVLAVVLTGIFCIGATIIVESVDAGLLAGLFPLIIFVLYGTATGAFSIWWIFLAYLVVLAGKWGFFK